MSAYKGSSLFLIRKCLEAKHPQAWHTFVSSLPPAERDYFNLIVSTAWVPVQRAEYFLQKFADALFPGDPDGFFKLGRFRARDTLQFLYRGLFKLLTPEGIIDSSYRLWPSLHDTGKATVERKPGAKEATFTVSSYPELPRNFRLMLMGFIVGCLEMAGAKNVQLRLVETDPEHWQWTGTWE